MCVVVWRGGVEAVGARVRLREVRRAGGTGCSLGRQRERAGGVRVWVRGCVPMTLWVGWTNLLSCGTERRRAAAELQRSARALRRTVRRAIGPDPGRRALGGDADGMGPPLVRRMLCAGCASPFTALAFARWPRRYASWSPPLGPSSLPTCRRFISSSWGWRQRAFGGLRIAFSHARAQLPWEWRGRGGTLASRSALPVRLRS